MADQWYLHREGARYGPYTWEQLRGYAQQGSVAAEDLVWCAGMAEWARAADVAGLLAAPPQPEAQPQPAAPPPPPAPAAESSTERVVGIIPSVQRKTGLFSLKTYNLVVTDRRMLFAEATSELLKQAAADAARESKEQGKGFLARAADSFTSYQRVYNRYWQMTPQAILAETPGNYALGLGEISSVRFHIQDVTVRFARIDDGTSQQFSDRMVLRTGREKIQLTFVQGKASEARALLQQVLGGIVR